MDIGERRLVEPYAGSAAVFFASGATNALLADLCKPLIATYRAIQAAPTAVANSLARLETQNTYEQVRSRDWRDLDDTDTAAWLIYLNCKAFNGIYRENAGGKFNVPEGTRQISLPPEGDLCEWSNRLRLTDLRVASAEETIRDSTAGDALYLDPPYPTERRHYGLYGSSQPPDEWMTSLLESIAAALAKGAICYLSLPERTRHSVLLPNTVLLSYSRRGRLGGNNGRGKEAEVLLRLEP